MLIAQITDLHIRPRGKPAYRVSETNMMVERAVDALLALNPRPDLVIVTGDMTDCGLSEEYELLRSILGRLTIPTYMVPGNHDRRETFREVFPDHPAMPEGFVQFTIEDGPVRLIGLDTLVPGESHGALCDRRLAFLEEALGRNRDKPTIIFMHHPPFACGIKHMDGIRLTEGAERLAEIVCREPQVERILCGHHHRPIQTRFAGTIASIAPSITHQVALDLTEEHEGALVFEPPAFQLHLFTSAMGLVSHTAFVERFPGPFPFVLDPDYPGYSASAAT
jgi:3',5'-cyclic AMP phosphodiesterase CpdA